MAAPSGYENPDEWELVDVDSFVLKRRKRQRLDPSAPPPPDPAAEGKRRREWEKATLLKLRDKYLREISQWELLSNTLKEMERNAQTQLLEPNQELDSRTTSFGGASSSEAYGSGSDSTRRNVIDDLLAKVEAEEAIIQNISRLCDVAEALCSAEEERLAQQFTDLPIWEPTPQELMAALGKQ
ncbi:hypothetical protein PHJA_002119800 [Phtheirospermum japonicum]|uniref:Uncharacterized protein n=1 Tax=Phtheirospermum japonicum TaxID=374723 RepID=A0A830CGB6_9LAMI|nr:hypothetical protein PHJA_002119800 [Phtheirospermum japonicum]